MATMDSGKRFNRESKIIKKKEIKILRRPISNFLFLLFSLSVGGLDESKKKKEKKDKIGARIYRQFPP
jgi:hypothetical protein